MRPSRRSRRSVGSGSPPGGGRPPAPTPRASSPPRGGPGGRAGASPACSGGDERARRAAVLREELPFELILEPGDGSPAVTVVGSIDRIDRLLSGGIEGIDYKTGRPWSQAGVEEKLPLSIYPLASPAGPG